MIPLNLSHIIEISVVSLLTIFILIQFVLINFLKRDRLALLTGLFSMICIGFSGYLWIKYGLIIEYGKTEDILQSQASVLSVVALLGLVVGLSFVALSIVKFIYLKLRKPEQNNV